MLWGSLCCSCLKSNIKNFFHRFLNCISAFESIFISSTLFSNIYPMYGLEHTKLSMFLHDNKSSLHVGLTNFFRTDFTKLVKSDSNFVESAEFDSNDLFTNCT